MKDTILVIEDEQDIQELFVYMLEYAGYATETASNGQRALEKIRAREYPVILTDLVMPGLNGLQVIEEVRKAWPDTQVVMITASTGVDSAVEAVGKGAFAYLSKPVKQDEMSVTVRNALAKYKLLKEKERIEAELRKFKRDETVYALLVVDSSGAIKNINKATEQMLGYGEGELAGKPVGDILGTGLADSPFQAAPESRKVEAMRVHFVGKDGAAFDMLFSGSVLWDNVRGSLGVVGTFKSA